MPQYTKIRNKSAKEKQQFFINLYVKHGAVEEKIAYCEKRATLKPGAGRKILATKAVKAQIKAKLEPLRLEQMKQAVITGAVQLAKNAVFNEWQARVDALREVTVDRDILVRELMFGSVCMDWRYQPEQKLAAIKTALVVAESPAAPANDGQWIYASIFNRPAQNSLPAAPEPLQSSPEEVFDLIPGKTPPEQSRTVVPLPPPGESLDESPVKPETDGRVITVEVG